MNNRMLSVGRTNRQGENGVLEKMEEWERMELLASLPTFPLAITAINNSAIIAPNNKAKALKRLKRLG